MRKILTLTLILGSLTSVFAQDGPFTFNNKTNIFMGSGLHWNADQDASTNLIWRSWSNRYFDFNGTIFRQDGKVGLGVLIPADKLTVDGNIQIYHPDTQYYNSPASLTLLNNALIFKHQHGNKNAEIRGAISPGKHTTSLVFRTKSTYATALENRMIIHPDGNVGIGINSPASKLHIHQSSGQKNRSLTLSGSWASSGTHYNMMSFKATDALANDVLLDNSSEGQKNFHLGLVSDDGYFNNDRFSIIQGGVERLVIDGYANSGNVGIGTTSPNYKLDVAGNAKFSSEVIAQTSIYLGDLNYIRLSSGANRELGVNYGILGGSFNFYSGTTSQFKINPNGHVGIGTTTPNEKLEVNGNALIDGELYSKKVKVSVNPGNWPDYVFAPSYELRALSEVEKYINQNQHLPDVPSAKEIETNGLDIGDMDATLMKKVEELTLYVLELEAGRQKLEVQNTELKKDNQVLKNTLNAVIKRLEKLEKK